MNKALTQHSGTRCGKRIVLAWRASAMRQVTCVLAVAASLVTWPVLAAELVVNGDFETDVDQFVTWPGYVGGGDNPPDVSGWFGTGGRGINPVQPNPDDNPSSIPLWQGGGGRGINPVNDPAAADPAPFRDNGDNETTVAFLQGNAFVRQDIAGLSVGTNYTLSLDYNSRNCCGDFPIAMLSLNGKAVPGFPDPDLFSDGVVFPTGVGNPWYQAEIPFTADAPTLTLVISAEPSAGLDASLLLDNIQLVSNAGGPNLIQNGDFELDADQFTVWPGYVSDDSRLAPFRDNGNNRSSVAFLQGAASLEQDVTGFTVGEEYVLSLDYNARNCCGDFPLPTVSLNGIPVDGFPDPALADGIVTPVGGDNAWYHFETAFTADGRTITLSIASTSSAGGDATLVVDNVSIMPKAPLLIGDFNRDRVLDAADIDLLTAAVRAQTHPREFDLTGDARVDQADRTDWVENRKRTYFGDANLDGEFNSSDFVQVFQAGQYEDGVANNSTWATGDWSGDGEFSSSDFVVAFQAGGFERGPRAAVGTVPEPAALPLLLAGVSLGYLIRRKD